MMRNLLMLLALLPAELAGLSVHARAPAPRCCAATTEPLVRLPIPHVTTRICRSPDPGLALVWLQWRQLVSERCACAHAGLECNLTISSP